MFLRNISDINIQNTLESLLLQFITENEMFCKPVFLFRMPKHFCTETTCSFFRVFAITTDCKEPFSMKFSKQSGMEYCNS